MSRNQYAVRSARWTQAIARAECVPAIDTVLEPLGGFPLRNKGELWLDLCGGKQIGRRYFSRAAVVRDAADADNSANDIPSLTRSACLEIPCFS